MLTLTPTSIPKEPKAKKPKSPKATTGKKESEKKQTKGQGRSYPSYASSSSAARSSNRRTNRTYSGRGSSSAGADPYGTQARAVARESAQSKRAKERRRVRRAEANATGRKKPLQRVKSIDEINGILKGMFFATKDFQEQPKNDLRGEADAFEKKLQTNMAKNRNMLNTNQSLRKNFNSLLDAYQARYKSIFDEQVANDGKTAPVTGTATRGAKGTDHRVKPKPLGSTTEDKKVMQS